MPPSYSFSISKICSQWTALRAARITATGIHFLRDIIWQSTVPTSSAKVLSEERREDLLGQRLGNSTLSFLPEGRIALEQGQSAVSPEGGCDRRSFLAGKGPGLTRRAPRSVLTLTSEKAFSDFLCLHFWSVISSMVKSMLHNSCSSQTASISECAISRQKSLSGAGRETDGVGSEVRCWMLYNHEP